VSTGRDPVVVLITAPPELAPKLARSIVEAHLAACVTMSPIRSIYRWKGDIQEDEETQLVVKTMRNRFGAIQAHLKAHHSYEVPELLMLPVVDSSPAYVAWMRAAILDE